MPAFRVSARLALSHGVERSIYPGQPFARPMALRATSWEHPAMSEPNPRPMGAAELSAIGQELLGPLWQLSLAMLLGVDPRTIQRCAAGSAIMPQAIAGRIVTLRDTVRQLRNAAATDRARLDAERATTTGTTKPAPIKPHGRLTYQLRKDG